MSAITTTTTDVSAMPLHDECLKDRMEVMFWQELTQYRTTDYLQMNSSASPELEETIMSEQWRTRMCEWAYQLVDHFDFPRHIVSNATNLLDRYLAQHFHATQNGVPRIHKKQFQLVTMCCLYVAMKINGSSRIPVSYMVQLSRGTVGEEELVAMETELLSSLSWRVMPPTAFDFLQHYLHLIQPAAAMCVDAPKVKSPRVKALEDLSSFLVELSVLDYYFVNFRPSTVAVAALLNSMDEDVHLGVANPFMQAHTLYHGYEGLVNPGEEEAVYLCRQRLGSLYQNSICATEAVPASPAPEDIKAGARITSPVSVVMSTTHPSYGC